jgi:hypothetical protein
MRMEEKISPRGMGMEEEMSPKREMGQGVVKYPPLNPRPVDIPIYMNFSMITIYF